MFVFFWKLYMICTFTKKIHTIKMAEFRRIAEIIDKDQLESNEKILDERIASASRQLNSLETKEMKLNKELKMVQKKLSDLQKTNSQLSKRASKLQESPSEPINKGSFFIQLRRVEAEIERLEQSNDSLKMVINSMKSEFNKANAKNKVLLNKRNDLHSQYDNVHNDEMAKKSHLFEMNDELNNKTSECDALKDNVEELKAKLEEKSQNIKKFTPEEAAFLTSQKESLQRELKQQLKILEDKQNLEKSINMKIQYVRQKRNRNFNSYSSTSNWVNERASLIAKLKKVRNEIKNLDTHQRGVSQTQAFIDELRFSKEDAKMSLIAERLSIPTKTDDFMKIAYEVEKEQTIRFENELSEIDRVYNEVSKFKTDVTGFTKMDEEIAENGSRITLLKDELASLRSKAV